MLELNPSLPKVRRGLAMACTESGDIESAKNHLIAVLWLNPQDAWGWVALGNLYAKNQQDWASAEKFLRRAMEIAHRDPWAVNGISLPVSANSGRASTDTRDQRPSFVLPGRWEEAEKGRADSFQEAFTNSVLHKRQNDLNQH